MNDSTFRIASRAVLAGLVTAVFWAAPSLAQEKVRCAVPGCTLTHEHTHAASSDSGSAVNEYEAFRMWRERTGRKDATYQDYLDAKNRGDANRGRVEEPPPPARRPDAPQPESRQTPTRVRPRPPVARPGDRDRRPERPVRTGPMHQDCRAHLNDYARFTEFPCIIERACKKCPTMLVMYASMYEYDKYNRLDEIRYFPVPCPNCHYENELRIKFRD